MRKIFYLFLKYSPPLIPLTIFNVCTLQARVAVKDHISMQFKKINYNDNNYVVTIEFKNISSEICKFGDSPASLQYFNQLQMAKGIIFFQGDYAYAADHKFEKIFTIAPKKSLTIQIPLEVIDKKITSKNKSVKYIFTYIRIGKNAPQYGIYQLFAPLELSN